MTDGALAAALEREHRDIDEGIEGFARDPSSAEARDLLQRAITALRRHIYLEEECLFPALRGDGGSALMAPIFVMLREHAQLWHSLDEVERRVAVDGAAPAVLNLCHQLLVQLQHHNMKEERILYPEADRVLPPTATARLAAFRESPAEWCKSGSSSWWPECRSRSVRSHRVKLCENRPRTSRNGTHDGSDSVCPARTS